MARAHSRWKVIAASAAGTSHAAAGTACQDAYDYRITADGIFIAAVADGAGSARFAGEGAALAVQSVIDFLTSALEAKIPETTDDCRALLRDGLIQTRLCLEERAAKKGFCGTPSVPCPEVTLGDFATTLLTVFVTDRHLAAFQVGDGAIVYREETGTLTVACEPDHGEYLNETRFVTSEDLEQHTHYRIESGRDISSLAILSDGLEMLAIVYRDNTAFGPFFNPFFDFVRGKDSCNEDLQQFISSERVCERSDDDKTLVLAVRV